MQAIEAGEWEKFTKAADKSSANALNKIVESKEYGGGRFTPLTFAVKHGRKRMCVCVCVCDVCDMCVCV